MFQNERPDKEEQRLYSETYNLSPAAFATFTQYVADLSTTHFGYSMQDVCSFVYNIESGCSQLRGM